MNAAINSVGLPELDSLQAALAEPAEPAQIELLEQARELEKWPIAQLISIFERSTRASLIARHQLMTYMKEQGETYSPRAAILGVTGAPGAGKSSLIGALCLNLLKQDPSMRIAVLAVDPSSRQSGGALLGDRTRTHFPVRDKRLFFRSQAAQNELGGVAKSTFHVTRLLRRLFDLVIIETVGIGQSEIEIQRLAAHTMLVLQPLTGDQIQFMKAGIMEVPDTYIINKCDEDALAQKSLHLLKTSLKIAKLPVLSNKPANEEAGIFMTSATRSKGINALTAHVQSLCRSQALLLNPSQEHKQEHEQESYFLNKWIAQAYGEFGLGVRAQYPEKPSLGQSSFELRELEFKRLITRFIKQID